jgi:hypothetical protein
MEMRTFAWLLPLVGSLLLLSSPAHAFLGWPPIRDRLAQGGVAGDLIAAIAIGWYFGSVAMAAFGVIVFLTWLEQRGKATVGRFVAGTVAVAYLSFGAAAYLSRSYNPHFLVAFLVPGVLLALPVVRCSWR